MDFAKSGFTSSKLADGFVTRSRVSPIIDSGKISVPKSFVATRDTTRLRSSSSPEEDIVAEVPIHSMLLALSRPR